MRSLPACRSAVWSLRPALAPSRLALKRTFPSLKSGRSRSKRTTPAEAPGPQTTVCGPLTTVSASKVSGEM
jgi:hypothetical protein